MKKNNGDVREKEKQRKYNEIFGMQRRRAAEMRGKLWEKGSEFGLTKWCPLWGIDLGAPYPTQVKKQDEKAETIAQWDFMLSTPFSKVVLLHCQTYKGERKPQIGGPQYALSILLLEKKEGSTSLT
ncbi:uncharacterized protein G2W53_017690 [Senna tora]|uniref:Uncharacterized protein n=1 Tax=Senna tora TaxID=362788 RepID=A0A834TTA3_9FABA|nr:uncharacterized protein G2W53_017690 [Senna tora]